MLFYPRCSSSIFPFLSLVISFLFTFSLSYYTLPFNLVFEVLAVMKLAVIFPPLSPGAGTTDMHRHTGLHAISYLMVSVST